MSFLPADDDRLIIIAFEGWNDAGEASVDAARHLAAEWRLTAEATLGGDEFYDLAFVRPLVERTEAGPRIIWPTCTKYSGTIPGTGVGVDIIIGMEPNYRWREFIGVLRAHIGSGDRVIMLAALLGDVPHTRPLPVSATTDDPAVAESFGIPESDYEGHTGIIGALSAALYEAGTRALMVWVAVPAYAGSTPSPKAVLALLGIVEELTGLVVSVSEIVEDARAWEHGTDALVESDDELVDHVARLEGMTDASDLPEASGEAIAKEFERYLSRRRRDG